MNGAGRCTDANGNAVDHCVVGEPGAPGPTSGMRTGITIQYGGYQPDSLRDRSYSHNKAGYLRKDYDTWRTQFQSWRSR